MARTKNRFNPIATTKEITHAEPKKIYKTALYARISTERSMLPSETIATQMAIMNSFLSTKDEFQIVHQYEDHGYSGTNFKRPAFEEMMSEVRKGNIDCIVVKDLSRLGRDYLETCNFIEVIFPFMNVRFISVNDHFDTNEVVNSNKELEISLKNLVNDMYAKDISKRISVARQQSRDAGSFTGSRAPYGYKVDTDSPIRRFVIDSEPAEVVQDIFDMVLRNFSLREIIRELQKRNLSLPGQYQKTGMLYQEEENVKPWYLGTLSAMISNETYIGNLIQGKRRARMYEGKKQEKVAPEEWIVIPNAHEAIIDPDVFRKANDICSSKYSKTTFANARDDIPIKPNKYAGILYCQICGQRLRYLSEIRSGNTRSYYFRCTNTLYQQSGKVCPVRITEQTLDQILLIRFRRFFRKLLKKRELNKAFDAREKKELESSDKILHRSQRTLQHLTEQEGNLYERYVMGQLTREQYLQERTALEEKEKEERNRIASIKSDQKAYHCRVKEKKKWFRALRRMNQEEILESELIHTLVKRIDVGPDHEISITYAFMKEE